MILPQGWAWVKAHKVRNCLQLPRVSGNDVMPVLATFLQ
jgi:hypothetical protein